MSLLKNGYILTNAEKVYHLSDLTGWYIKESGVCDLPDELRAIQKYTGKDIYIDWTSGWSHAKPTDFAVVRAALEITP
jgi:hypothetical protein